MLSGLDIGIIILYFVMVTIVGLVASRKASGSINDYFLGGRNIPWYILGISGMATFVDITGTMLQVSFFFFLGVKGYWVTFRGALALFLAFYMIFIAKWLNRSRVMTNAEWVKFRFGTDRQGHLAHFISAVFMLVFAVPLVSYFFVGTGKFLTMYLPYSPTACALVFFGIMTIYTVAAGFYGVVYTDLFQSVLILGIIIFVAVKSMSVGTPDFYATVAPSNWRSLIPSWETVMPQGYENMRFLALLIVFWFISNVFQGFASPLDGHSSQRYYAAKNERESSLVAFQWIVLMSLRFLMMMGFGVLAIGIAGRIADPEMALPAVVNEYIPYGMKGVLIVALIAAEMSTLDSVVNASGAYFVNDIYRQWIKPKASPKHLMKVSYITTITIIVMGVVIGIVTPNINSIWSWIIMGLLTGIIPPGILKWFWWRFNGLGYAFGIGSGLLGALVSRIFFIDTPEYITFSIVIAVSTIGTVIGTFLGRPTGMEVLKNFYTVTRPFGFWEPIRKQCDPGLVREVKQENRRDLLLLGPACIWQMTLFWIMTALIVKKWISFSVSLAVVVVLSFVLYRYWYLNLKRD